MKCAGKLAFVISAVLALAWTARAQEPPTEDLSRSHAWAESNLAAKAVTLPFSFVLDGVKSSEAIKTWTSQEASRTIDERRDEKTLTFRDSKTGLVVRCVAIVYRDFPTVEWTLHFENKGTADTPILEKIQALDMRMERGATGEFVLHHSNGSLVAPADFQPFQTPMGPKEIQRFHSHQGRPCIGKWPYFNVESPAGGTIVAVGWPGQWAAEFERDAATGLTVRAGQELTHFKLHPGESVRSPLIVLQFWHGDRVDAQNAWRRWMLAHNVPRPGGKVPQPRLAGCTFFVFGGKSGASDEISFIDRYRAEQIPLGYWWIDAGWYTNQKGWPQTGTWEPDPQRFPKGLREVADHAHENDLKLVAWFSPEWVQEGTWLYEHHPEWLLSADPKAPVKVLNLGNPAALDWITNHIDKLITDQQIDVYRQDLNLEPLDTWRKNDAPDRQGITEIAHVTGYLKYYDELLRRHPNLLIDTCASGAGRNDLESLRRAIPLWRCDYIFEPIGTQCHTYSLASWIPLFGTGLSDASAYAFRSNMCAFGNCQWDVRKKDLDYASLRRLAAEWSDVSPCYSGDYYPLTRYSLDPDVWMAWQFHRPDLGVGMVQVFRRPESAYESARFQLKGLDPAMDYVVKNFDSTDTITTSGRVLMEDGLTVAIKSRAKAETITYKKAR